MSNEEGTAAGALCLNDCICRTMTQWPIERTDTVFRHWRYCSELVSHAASDKSLLCVWTIAFTHTYEYIIADTDVRDGELSSAPFQIQFRSFWGRSLATSQYCDNNKNITKFKKYATQYNSIYPKNETQKTQQANSDLSPLTTFCQETRWAYSTLPSRHRRAYKTWKWKRISK